MKDFLHFEVFSFGEYMCDLTTNRQFNKVKNLSEQHIGLNLPEFNEMLKRNGLHLKSHQLQKVASEVIQNHCSSIDTKENGFDKQWVIILKKFSN